MKEYKHPTDEEILKAFRSWYDYAYLVDLICMKLRYDAEHYRLKGYCLGSDERAEEMIKCANFLEKASDPMNYNDDVKEEGYIGNDIWDEVERRRNSDLKEALSIIEQKLDWWWD